MLHSDGTILCPFNCLAVDNVKRMRILPDDYKEESGRTKGVNCEGPSDLAVSVGGKASVLSTFPSFMNFLCPVINMWIFFKILVKILLFCCCVCG